MFDRRKWHDDRIVQCAHRNCAIGRAIDHAGNDSTIGELQESLDYLRLSVKYLVFDLEATRRENKYLRSLIETRHDGDDAQG